METVDFNTIDQMNLTHIYRIFHSTAAEYTFLSNAHGTLCRIDHMLATKQVSKNSR